MKYIIPQDKIDNIVFKYLDLNLKGLEKKNKHGGGEGIVFTLPEETYGLFFWNGVTLYIEKGIITFIHKSLGLNSSDSENIIRRWFENKYHEKVFRSQPLNIGNKFFRVE